MKAMADRIAGNAQFCDRLVQDLKRAGTRDSQRQYGTADCADKAGTGECGVHAWFNSDSAGAGIDLGRSPEDREELPVHFRYIQASQDSRTCTW